jgi:hypothetical protein
MFKKTVFELINSSYWSKEAFAFRIILIEYKTNEETKKEHLYCLISEVIGSEIRISNDLPFVEK